MIELKSQIPNSLPTLSVVIPSYNQGAFIERTIQSIVRQNYPKLDLILMDGGSTDKTMEIVTRYKKHFSHIISGPDGGQSAAIAKGFELSTGKYISWLNSDDTYNDGALMIIGNYLAQHPETQFVYGNMRIIDVDDNEKAYKKSVRFYLPVMKYAFLTVPQMSAFWTKDLYLRAGGVDRVLQFCMDYDLFVRMAQISAPVRINKTIGNFRVHETSKTTNLEDVRLREDMIVQERYCAVKPSSGVPFRVVRFFMRLVLVAIMLESGGLFTRLKTRFEKARNKTS
jgi:glycosyltransferase involved in cell wall biosynthesis